MAWYGDDHDDDSYDHCDSNGDGAISVDNSKSYHYENHDNSDLDNEKYINNQPYQIVVITVIMMGSASSHDEIIIKI